MNLVIRMVLWLIIGLRMVVLVRALRAASPPREPRVYQGAAVMYRISRDRYGNIISVDIGVAVPDRVRFRLQPETRFDEFAKQLGLATEWQVNDPEFDNKVFVVSDDPIFLRALSNDRELREQALALMKKFGGATLRCSAGCLWVQVKPGLSTSGPDEAASNRVLRKALEHLLAIAERIRVISSTAWDANRDRSARAELTLYIVLEVLGIAGILAFLFSGGSGPNRQLLFTNTALWTTGVTLAIAAVVVVMFVAIMRKSSRAHLLLFELVVLGVPGVSGLVFAGACWANRHEDTAPAVQQVVQVQHRYITKGRGNSKNYHLVMDWPDPRVDKEFGVAPAVYRQYDTTRCAQVMWGRGYLNDPYLAGMQPVECD